MSGIGTLIRQLSCQVTQQRCESAYALHMFSVSSRDGTNGVSEVASMRVRRSSPYQTRTESRTVIATSIRNTPQTAASRRLLKIWVAWRPHSRLRFSPPRWPIPASSLAPKIPAVAPAKEIFCHAGSEGDHQQPRERDACDPHVFGAMHLDKIVVATHRAIALSNWFAMPNSGHSELIPPSGSSTP